MTLFWIYITYRNGYDSAPARVRVASPSFKSQTHTLTQIRYNDRKQGFARKHVVVRPHHFLYIYLVLLPEFSNCVTCIAKFGLYRLCLGIVTLLRLNFLALAMQIFCETAFNQKSIYRGRNQ